MYFGCNVLWQEADGVSYWLEIASIKSKTFPDDLPNSQHCNNGDGHVAADAL
jgi:hypothetical protein